MKKLCGWCHRRWCMDKKNRSHRRHFHQYEMCQKCGVHRALYICYSYDFRVEMTKPVTPPRPYPAIRGFEKGAWMVWVQRDTHPFMPALSMMGDRSRLLWLHTTRWDARKEAARQKDMGKRDGYKVKTRVQRLRWSWLR